MPEITNRGWARMDLDDPADRKLLIESGVIWRCGQRAVQMAVEDLVDGVVPMNDKVPPEIAAIIQKIQESRAKFTKDIAAKSKAAQEQAFVGLDDPGDTPEVIERTRLAKAAGPIWACPNGHDTVNVLESRKGRVYGMCTTCHAFEGGDVLPNAATPVPASVPDPKVDPKRPEPTYTATPDFWYKSICQYCKTPLGTGHRWLSAEESQRPSPMPSGEPWPRKRVSYLGHVATKSETCDPADLYRVRHPVAPPDPLGRSRMKVLLDDNLWRVVTVAIMLAILFASFLIFTSDIGHWYLCDTPGSKVCQ
jgi:hypothetical protein